MKIKVIEYNKSVDVIVNKYENEKKAIDRLLETRYKGESRILQTKRRRHRKSKQKKKKKNKGVN